MYCCQTYVVWGSFRCHSGVMSHDMVSTWSVLCCDTSKTLFIIIHYVCDKSFHVFLRLKYNRLYSPVRIGRGCSLRQQRRLDCMSLGVNRVLAQPVYTGLHCTPSTYMWKWCSICMRKKNAWPSCMIRSLHSLTLYVALEALHDALDTPYEALNALYCTKF